MSTERDTFVYDRSYGSVDFTESELRLFQTREIARLRQVSLSATPPWLLQAGNCATRFEHSVGVAHLAKFVGRNKGFADIAEDLYFASLAHDMGSPPFSHLSEGFLFKQLGVTHEEFAANILENSEYAGEVERQGGSIENIRDLILGNFKPISDVLNGSVDIDNLDNVLRYGLSIGLISTRLYSPEMIAGSFRLESGKVVLLSRCVGDLKAWEDTRRLVYDYVYNVTNISPNSMIHRAIDLASKEGEIGEPFFRMTDAEAFNFLKNRCNSCTANLIERAESWHFYPAVLDFQTSNPSEKLKEMSAKDDNRGTVSDQIAGELKLPKEDVCVYLRKSKGFREIHLPIMDVNGNQTSHEQSGTSTWLVQVFVNSEYFDKAEEVAELSRSILEL